MNSFKQISLGKRLYQAPDNSGVPSTRAIVLRRVSRYEDCQNLFAEL